MGQYKKGDWVRCVDNGGVNRLLVSGAAYKVDRADDHYIFVGGLGGMVYSRFEPWWPKVGERVRVTASANSVWAGEATVKEIRPTFFVLSMTSGRNAGFEGGFTLNELEPVTDPLPVAEQPAALKIEAGRYYKTRDGRKVGPMRRWRDDSAYDFESDNFLWKSDGENYDKGSVHTIIAEWVAPTTNLAATVDAINDEYGPVVPTTTAADKPKFKLGDVVRSILTGQVMTVTAVDRAWHSGKPVYTAKGDKLAWGRFVDGQIELATPTTAIVALIENGQPLPADRPAVHTSTEAADAEARRLASVHKGQEFGVFVLTGTTHKEAKVYEHEWQRLAAGGDRIQAIKALRAITGMYLKSAKTAVDDFLAAA